jgi:hypothetical protein
MDDDSFVGASFCEEEIDKKRLISIFLTSGSIFHRIGEYSVADPRFSLSPQRVRCDYKEPMRDKVSAFLSRDLRKTMGRRRALTREQRELSCNEVERCIEIQRQRWTFISESSAETSVCARWKTEDGRDLR